MGKVDQLMDVITYTIEQPSFWLTTVINVIPIFVLFGLSILVYLIYRHLRDRNVDEEPRKR
jgi:hypothetical protein